MIHTHKLDWIFDVRRLHSRTRNFAFHMYNPAEKFKNSCDDEDEGILCFAPITDAQRLWYQEFQTACCRNTMHVGCLRHWETPSCPFCRAKWTSEELDRLQVPWHPRFALSVPPYRSDTAISRVVIYVAHNIISLEPPDQKRKWYRYA